jgi:hypothetical protein
VVGTREFGRRPKMVPVTEEPMARHPRRARTTCQDRRPKPRQCHAAAVASRRLTRLSHVVWARARRDVGHGAGEHGGALVVVEAITSGLLMVLDGRSCCTLLGCFLSSHYRLVRSVGGVLGGGTGASGCGVAAPGGGGPHSSFAVGQHLQLPSSSSAADSAA